MARMILSSKTRRRWPSWMSLLLTAFQITASMAQGSTSMDNPITAATVSASPPDPTSFQLFTSTNTPEPQTHTVQVGLLDHKIRPETTNAAIGDIIEFDFYPLNHSVVRSEYGFPCIPYEMTGTNKKGFFSGFNPVDKVLDSPPKYSLRINDSEPIFFYCSAPGSCITYGMVGGINLNGNMSIDRQRTLAMDSAFMLQPGEPFSAESPLPSGIPASSVLPSSLASSSQAPGTDHSAGGLSKGTIAGIIVAAICAILFGALLFFCWGRTKSLREAIERKDGTVRRVSASPNQMVEYKDTRHHMQPYHAHNNSQAGYRFPTHPTVHPGSPSPGYAHQHQHQDSVTGYFPPGQQGKYTSPTAAHPAYHAMSPGSPPTGNLGLAGHPFMHSTAHDPLSRGTPAPEYYPRPQGRGQVQEWPVEMEGISAVIPAAEVNDSSQASKF